MSSITEVKTAIQALSESEFVELRTWFSNLDYERWDRQFEADVKAGRLDFLIEDVREAKANNAIIELTI